MATNHTTAHRPILNSPAEYTIVGILVIALAATLWVWTSGQLAGLVFGFTWIDVSLGEGLSAAWHLPAHLADPRQAWPPSVRNALPGPVGLYIMLATTAITMAITSIWCGRKLTKNRRTRGFASREQLSTSLSHKASLARADRLRPDLATKPVITDVAVDLGRGVGSGLALAAPIDSSVLLLAAPRVGKTSQVIIPWLADWPGPALVTSVRRDVADNTYKLRRSRGPVAVFDLSDMAWPEKVAWSPTSGCESFDKARERAGVMVTVGKTENSDSTNAGFFGMTATNLLAGWLHAAALHGLSMETVLTWALDESDQEPVNLLRQHCGAAPGIAALLDSIYHSPHETRSNMWATVLTGVAPLLSPDARRAFCPTGAGFDIEAFLRESGTVYLHVSENQAHDLAPLVSALVDEITIVAKRLADAHPTGRLDPPLGMILDEVANVVPLPNLPALMSYAAGSGIFVVAVLQHIAGARQRWGREGADMLWSAATLKIALGGLSGEELDRFSALAGEYREHLTTTQHSHHHGASTSTSVHDRKTVNASAVRTLSADDREALIAYSTTPVVKTRMRRHYETRHAKHYKESVADMQAATASTPRTSWNGGAVS